MKRTYKASPSSYAIFGIPTICLLGFVFLTFYLGIASRGPADLFCAFLFAVLPIFVFWWLSRFRLTIGPDSISYSSAFGKEQSVDLADARDAEVVLVYERRMLFLAIKTPTEIKMRIHHKVFSREAYQDLCRTVMPDSVSQQVDVVPQKPTAFYQKRWLWYVVVGLFLLLGAGLLEWFY
ncbi:MAG: hypothetical protein ABSE16_19390 [Verrucomicrobiota bacterium]|jgi:hypothetical protein